MDIPIKDKIESFCSVYTLHAFKKGTILIRPDGDPLGIFFLKEGIVKQYAISAKGDEIILNIFKPISFFPMPWAVNNSANIYFYEAIAGTRAYVVPKDKVLEFIKNDKEILYDLLTRIFTGLDGIFFRMTYLMSGTARARLITEIIILAKRFGQTRSNRTKVELKIYEKDLASQTGITRETVSREITQLKEKGLLEFNRNTLVITNLSRLEGELLNNS